MPERQTTANVGSDGGLPPDPDCPLCDGVGLISYGNGQWEVCACTGLMEDMRRAVLVDAYKWIVDHPNGLFTEFERERHQRDKARLASLQGASDDR